MSVWQAQGKLVVGALSWLFDLCSTVVLIRMCPSTESTPSPKLNINLTTSQNYVYTSIVHPTIKPGVDLCQISLRFILPYLTPCPIYRNRDRYQWESWLRHIYSMGWLRFCINIDTSRWFSRQVATAQHEICLRLCLIPARCLRGVCNAKSTDVRLVYQDL